jgi:hypothetical protein
MVVRNNQAWNRGNQIFVWGGCTWYWSEITMQYIVHDKSRAILIDEQYIFRTIYTVKTERKNVERIRVGAESHLRNGFHYL